jgi:sugar lactone lactonase YvrE
MRFHLRTVLLSTLLGLATLGGWPASAVDVSYPTRITRRFTPGEFLEGIAAGRDGTLFISLQRVDGSADIVRVTKDGRQSTVARLPGVGTLAFTPDGVLHATVIGGFNAEVPPQVWRITPAGVLELEASMPAGSQPNGITSDWLGNLYIADSALGTVWKLSPPAYVPRAWAVHPLLSADAQPPFFPGANGIKLFHGAAYVSVSDTGNIVRIPLLVDGRAGTPTVYASQLPTDDFAFDWQGNLYATTHPFNTVVRLAPNGTRQVIADLSTGANGPTAAAFGKTWNDFTSLYVVTDGDYFNHLISGVPLTEPHLLRIDLGTPGAWLP